MPLLTEADAVQVRDTFDLLGDHEKPVARQWLQRYVDQQAEFGAPLYPAEEAASQESTKAFRSQFQGLDKSTAPVSEYSDDPDRDKAIHANIPFLAQRFGVPAQTIADRPDFYRGEYARQKFNVPGGIDDKAFYGLAAKEVNDQAAKEKTALEGAHEGMRAALSDMGTFAAMPGLAADAMASPDEEVKHKALFDAYKRTGDVLSKHRGLLTTLSDGTERYMLGKPQEGDAEAMASAAASLDALPGAEYRIVLGALKTEAQKRGEANSSDKESGRGPMDQGKYLMSLLQQTGEAGGRLLNSGLSGSSNADIVQTLDALPVSGSVRVNGPLNSAADADRYVSDALSFASGQRFNDQSPNPAPVRQEGEDITLTPEQTMLINAAKDRAARRVRRGQELDSIGSAVDPIPNLFASTIGTSAALVGVIAATRGTAAPVLASLYKGAEYEELSVKYPQMSHADKSMVSGMSGAIQAAGDFVEFSALKNLPGLKSLIAGNWKGELIKRALGRAAGAYIVENVVEAGQDIATPALMAALTSDVPGYDWGQEKADFWKGRANVAIGMLPLTLLGIGAASVQEYRGAKSLLSWSDKLGAQGIVEPDRIAISEAAQSGNVQAAQGLLRDAWGRRDATVAAEFQDRMQAADAQTASVTAEYVRRGLLPDIRLDGRGGATVTSEGKTVRFSSWDQARDVATQHMTEIERHQSEMVAAIAERLMLGKGETVDVKQRSETLGERVQSGKSSPAEAMDAAIASGLLKGVSAQEAQTIAHHVFGGETVDARTEAIRQTVVNLVALGSNQVTGGRSRSTVNLQGNAQPFLTAVEEVVEGRWKGGLSSNKFTKAQGVAWVKMAEQATGEKFLEGATHDDVLASAEVSPRALTEAISRIVVADVLGRLQDGKRITPGSVGGALDLNDRQTGAFAAILRAFSEFFKAVLDIADKLFTARSEGKLGADYDSLFDQLTGSNGQTVHENAVADVLAAEMVDTSGYSEETPGPNGETFSLRAVPSDGSKVVAMPDGARLVGPTTFSIRAHHGTPHKVDKFSLDKIGTGEGAQAYGWGLYFAQSEKVADSYRTILSARDNNLMLDGKPIAKHTTEEQRDNASDEAIAQAFYAPLLGGKTKEDARSFLKSMRSAAVWQDALTVFDTGRLSFEKDGTGNLYTVDLLPDEEDFLDWDKPLSEQGEKGKALLELFRLQEFSSTGGFYDEGDPQKATGKDAYQAAMESEGNGANASAMLLDDFGIKGIRYLDGDSRSQGDGASNYVLFDDSLVKIIAENGKPVSGETFSLGKLGLLGIVDGDGVVHTSPVNTEQEWLDKSHWQVFGMRAERSDRFRFEREYEDVTWTLPPSKDSRNAVENFFARRGIMPRQDSGSTFSLSPAFQQASKESAAILAKQKETLSLTSHDFAARMASAMSPFDASPALRREMSKIALARVQRVGAEWVAQSAKQRGAKSINKEAAVREAVGYDERVNAYLDGLSPAQRQDLEFEPADLENDPLIHAMLSHGRLMSRSTAMQQDRLSLTMGEFDGVPWLPPSWYSKGSGIMPDQMAQAMHDAHLLPDGHTDTLWATLAARIESSRKDKARARGAAQAYKDALKAARTDAKLEATAWANKERATSGSDATQRKMLQGGLRTLDALLSAVPPEVRVKVGGFVKLAGLATDDAMLKEIEARIQKLDEELTKWLRKEGLDEVTALFKKAAADYTAGKKAKGKLGADEHFLFQRAEAVSRMTEVQVAGELAKIDAILASDTLTPQEEVTAEMERGIVDLCGNLFPRSMDSGKMDKNGRPIRVRGYEGADVGRIYSAIDALTDLMRYGILAQKQRLIARRERWQSMQRALIASTGTAGTQRGRDAAEKVAATFTGKLRSTMLSLSSFHELLTYSFGESDLVSALIDMERDASNQYEDENQEFADGLEALFVRLAGGGKRLESDELAGERLRFSMAQKNIDTGTSTISQLQAIDALLTWRQEDGRRHMEGTFDENGKVTSSWSYDQAWIDRVTAEMSPEAFEVMAWVSDNYASEWAELNPLYRERNGVNMAQNNLYSPISVKPVTAKQGEMIDPSTGHSTTGSILTPGSLRTRSTTAVAEPDFRDAVSKIIAHKKMMAHWKAYYDLAQEMTGILGNREVMNAVEAKASREAVLMVGKWRDAIATNGVKDASAGVALTEGMRAVTNRAATVGLLGRLSVLAVQSTQLAAASVKMPVLDYTTRLAKLTSGKLEWSDAINSPFMQRRIKSAPPIVRQAMQSLATAKSPNQISRAVRWLGQLVSAADGLFTGGTYAILLDYHRTQGRNALLVGAELEEYAHGEAERETEQVAQPVRMATRSFFEVASTNPLAKVGWAYASEARQKLALAAWGLVNAKKDPVYAAKVVFLATVVGGLLPAVLKNLLKEAGGDDKKEKWSVAHLMGQTLASPFHGIPLVDELSGNGGMLSGLVYSPAAIERLLNGEDDSVRLIKDVDTILSAAALLPIPGADNLAGLAAMSHVFTDAVKMLGNAFGD